MKYLVGVVAILIVIVSVLLVTLEPKRTNIVTGKAVAKPLIIEEVKPCSASRVPGARCEDSCECLQPATCFRGKCSVDPKLLGSECGHDKECQSGYCQAGKCAPRRITKRCRSVCKVTTGDGRKCYTLCSEEENTTIL